MFGPEDQVPSGKNRLFVSHPAAKRKGLINSAGPHHRTTHTDTHSWKDLNIRPTSKKS